MRILFAGDFCPQGRMKNFKTIDQYSKILTEVKELIQTTDYSVVNLECPIFDGDLKPIKKIGPNLKGSPLAIKALREVGFNCLTLANNHIMDYGQEGLDSTINLAIEKQFDVVGVSSKSEEEQHNILYKEIAGCRFTIINCCEHEFSIAFDSQKGCTPLDEIDQYYSIKDAKKKSDYVFVIVHGGIEGYQFPTPRMKKLYHFFIDAGADAVINHHQHCFSGYEYYNNKPIYYGIGNFCFDWPSRNNLWNEGLFVIANIDDKGISWQYLPFTQFLESDRIEIKERCFYDDRLEDINKVIAQRSLLEKQTKEYFAKTTEWYGDFLMPLTNRYILALQSRNLFPRFASKKWLRRVYSVINCESHRERLLFYLRNKIFS